MVPTFDHPVCRADDGAVYQCLAHSQASHQPLVQQVALDVICEYSLIQFQKTDFRIIYVLLVYLHCFSSPSTHTHIRFDYFSVCICYFLSVCECRKMSD